MEDECQLYATLECMGVQGKSDAGDSGRSSELSRFVTGAVGAAGCGRNLGAPNRIIRSRRAVYQRSVSNKLEKRTRLFG